MSSREDKNLLSSDDESGRSDGDEEQNEEKDLLFGWSGEDTRTLVNQMLKMYPSYHALKKGYKAQLLRLDWTKVAFDNRTAEDCHSQWEKISPMLRKFRTLPDLLIEALDLLKNTDNIKRITAKMHPDMPKKPVTTFFMYYNSHLPKLKKEFPGKRVTELARLCSQRYSELSEKKKGKYMRVHAERKKEYDTKMEEFKKEHPHMDSSQTPKKPQSAKELFISHNVHEIQSQNSDLSLKEMRTQSLTQWTEMPDSDKLTWIVSSEKDHQRYQEEMESHMKKHPDFCAPNVKSKMTKEDMRIKRAASGVPQKPPASGYSLFCSELMKNLSELHVKEKFKTCSHQWKALSPRKKQKYNNRVVDLKHSYQQYNANSDEATSSEPPTKKAKKVTLDTEPKESPYRNIKKPKKAKVVEFVGEPKKPGNVYSHYCKEMMEVMKKEGVKNSDRMAEISQRWKGLSNEARARFDKKHKKAIKTYQKEVRAFVGTLGQDEKDRFAELRYPVLGKKQKQRILARKALEASVNAQPETDTKKESDDESSDHSRAETSSPLRLVGLTQVPSAKKKIPSPPKQSGKKTASELGRPSSSSETETDEPPQPTKPLKKRPKPTHVAAQKNKPPSSKKSHKNRPDHTDNSDVMTSPENQMLKIKPLKHNLKNGGSTSQDSLTTSDKSSSIQKIAKSLSIPFKTVEKKKGKGSSSSSSSSSSDSSDSSSDDSSNDEKTKQRSLNKQKNKDVFSD